MSLAENNYVQYHHRAALVVLAGVSAANRAGSVVGRESAGARAEASTTGTTGAPTRQLRTLSLSMSLTLSLVLFTFLALFVVALFTFSLFL